MTPSFWQLSQNCWQIPSKSTYQIGLHNGAHGQQSNTFASSPGTPHPRDLRPGTPARVHLPRPSLEIPTRMTLAWGRAPHAQGAHGQGAIRHGPWPTADGDRGHGCPPALPGATHRDTWLTFGSLFRRLRPRAPGCTPLGGALGSSQGVFPLLFALRCQPFLSPRGDASPSVFGTRPPSVAHLFCAPSTGGCILAQGIQCMHRRSPMQSPSDAFHACSCVQDPIN